MTISMHPERRDRARRLVAGLLVLVAALGVALGIGEVVLRLWWPQPNPFLGHASYRADPELGYVLAPNYHADLDTRINRLGMRGPDPSPARADGSLRLAFIGDSFVYGGETWESTFPVQTARALQPSTSASIEVVNAGVPGYSLRHYPVRLGRDVLPLAPDVVVLGVFYGNDLDGIESPDPRVIEGDLVAPDAVVTGRSGWQRAWERSAVLRLIANGVEMLRLSLAVREGGWSSCYSSGNSAAIGALLTTARAARAVDDSVVEKLAGLLEDEAHHRRPPSDDVDPFALGTGLPGRRERLRNRIRVVLQDQSGPVTEERLARDVCPLVRELRFEPPIRDRAWFGPDQNFIEDLLTSPETSARFWSEGRERLADLVAKASAAGVRLLVVGIPQVAQVDPVWRKRTLDILGLHGTIDWEAPGRWLTASGEELGVATLDLTPSFARAIEGGAELYRRFDGHWNSEGERVAGSETARRLVELGWEKSPPARAGSPHLASRNEPITSASSPEP